MSPLDDLKKLIPPPVHKLNAIDPGEGLPADFRDLIKEYGTGAFDSFLWLMTPSTANPHLNISQQTRDYLDALRFLESLGEDIPYAIDASNPELKCWGMTDNGDICSWVTESRHPQEWSVAVNAPRDGEWAEYKGSVTEFLVEIYSGRRFDAFPDDFPDDEPHFLPEPQFVPEPQPEPMILKNKGIFGMGTQYGYCRNFL